MVKRKYIAIIFFIPFFLLFASYPWPVSNFNSSHPITGTLGEFRDSPLHFHKGVDIGEGSGIEVYPVVDGVVTNIFDKNEDDECVEITNNGIQYEYTHINSSVEKYDNVEAGVTLLGTIKDISHPHLHFEVDDGMNNPLDNGLTPYSDTETTTVWGGDEFKFYRQGGDNDLTSPLHGKVDILCKAKDRQDSPGSQTVGIYRIGYQVNDKEGNAVLPYTENIKFDDVNGHVQYVYDVSQSDKSTYYYWVTNALGTTNYQRWWNTRLKQGESWDGDDALINENAEYPDGDYKVWVMAYDIEGNGGDTLHERGAVDEDILLDNFAPFVKKVLVKRAGEMVYRGFWELNDDNMKLNSFKRNVYEGDELTITLDFSEEMDTTSGDVYLKSAGNKIYMNSTEWISMKTLKGEVTLPDDIEADVVLYISGKDLSGNMLDGNPKIIAERVGEQQWNNYDEGTDINHKLYGGNAPIVTSTTPSENTKDIPVDLNPISITFSREMDKIVTQDAISIISEGGNFVPFTSTWDGNKTLKIKPSVVLDYYKRYLVLITDEAKDTSGVKLDGDKDGEPGGDDDFYFKTEKPPLNLVLDPSNYHFELENEYCWKSEPGTLTVDGSDLLKEVHCNLEKSASGFGLSFSGGEGAISLMPGDIKKKDFMVTAYDEGGIKVKSEVVSQENENNIYEEELGSYSSTLKEKGEHPDENQSPGETNYPTPFVLMDDTTESSCNIGIFIYGWTFGYSHLLGKYGIPIIPMFSDLEYWKNPDTTLSDVIDLLVIGSGALSGLTTPQFEQRLKDYVLMGGNLLVLTQKYGSDFSVLPGYIDGYGWHEDQSCFHYAAYLNQWHPVFSSQTEQCMDCHVDGYISTYPDYSEVFLRRTKNGMPALLSYNYGAGTVIVSSMYPDWGYGHNQISQEELKLFRDLTTWAMNPEFDIPEFYPDSSVSVPVTMRYSTYDTVETGFAKLKVLTPNRELYDSITIPVCLNHGEEFIYDWNETVFPDTLGLWMIDYALMDSNSNIIQNYSRGAIFSKRIDVPTGNYNLDDFQMWAIAGETVLKHDTVDFELFIKNNSDSLFEGKIMGGDHGIVVDSMNEITVPADSLVKVDFPFYIYKDLTIWFGLYEEGASNYERYFTDALTRCMKGVHTTKNPFSVTINTDTTFYESGFDSVNYFVHIENVLSSPCSIRVEIANRVDSTEYILLEDTLDLSSGNQKLLEGKFFPLDYDTTWTETKLTCNVFYQDSLYIHEKASYGLLYPDVYSWTILPDSFNYNGENLYEVKLISDGDYLPPGKLYLSGKHYFDTLSLGYSSNPETTLTLKYQPVKWRLNDWILSNFRYGNQCTSIKKDLPFEFPRYCQMLPGYVWGKSKSFYSYKNSKFKTKVRGRGSLYGAPLLAWVHTCPPGGDTLKDTVIIKPDSTSHVTAIATIDTILNPEKKYKYSYGYRYLGAGKEYIIVKGGYVVKRPMVGVECYFCRDTFKTSERIPIAFANSHLQGTDISVDSFRIFGNGVSELLDGPGIMNVPAESSVVACSLDVPEWITGEYDLNIFAHTMDSNWVLRGMESYPFYIDGIESFVEVNSIKDWYRYDEEKIFNSLIENTEVGYKAMETLSVYPFEEKPDSLLFHANDIEAIKRGIRYNEDTALIDTTYSLHKIAEYPLPGRSQALSFNKNERGFSLPMVDDMGNIWSFNEYNKTFKKYNNDFTELLDSFRLVGTGRISGACMQDGWIYSVDPDSGMVRKINSITGDIADGWRKSLMYPSDITSEENGNLLVVDNGTKLLWEFTTNGDSISTEQLPASKNYLDIEEYNGKVYLCCLDKILTLQSGVIDSFDVSESSYHEFFNIALSKEGKIAASWWLSSERATYITLFSSSENEEAVVIGGGDLAFEGEDILSLNSQNARFYREFGVDKGMIVFPKEMFQEYGICTFIDYRTFCEPGVGTIINGGTYENVREGIVTLDDFKGTHHLPDIVFSLDGNTQQPKFHSMEIVLNLLSMDTVVGQWTYDPYLPPFGQFESSDTISDSLSPSDYAIIADVNTDLSQEVSSGMDYFTVIGDEISLVMHRDTNDMPPGWIYHPNIMVINPLPDSQENLELRINRGDSVYLDTLFSMDSSSVDSFPIDVKLNEPAVLEGDLIIPTGDTIEKELTLNVITGLISLDAKVDDIAGLEPFSLETEVENQSRTCREVIINREYSGGFLTDTIEIPSLDETEITDTISIIHSESLKIIALWEGGKDSLVLPVEFGISGEIEVDSFFKVAPDSVEITGTVSNEGVYPVLGKALFCLVDGGLEKNPYSQGGIISNFRKISPSSIFSRQGRRSRSNSAEQALLLQEKIERVGKEITFDEFIEELVRADIDTSLTSFHLTPGQTDTIPIIFNSHEPGAYAIKGYLFTDTLSVLLDSTNSSLEVIGNSLISIDSIFNSPTCDSTGLVPVFVILSNDSYDSFYGNLTLISDVCYTDTTVEISALECDTVELKLKGPVDEGKYKFNGALKEGGAAISVRETWLEFHPVYIFNAIPEELSYSMGDSGDIYVEVINAGNGIGERKISVNWVDVINLNIDTIINPSALSEFHCRFYVPEDIPGGDYFCEFSILNGGYPEIDTFIPLNINGISITAWDSLDNPVYEIGDTALFSIFVENSSQWSGELDAGINYGYYSDDTSFILGGMEENILNDSLPVDTLLFDTSAVYLFDPLLGESRDSFSFEWIVSSDSLELSFRTDSAPGCGNWFRPDTGAVYPLDDWLQLRVENNGSSVEWLDLINLKFDPPETLFYDIFSHHRETILFSFPVTGEHEKAGWGIYHPSGRSIVLDERYIYLMDDSLTIFTDKGRYESMDTVNATIWKHFPGSGYEFSYRVYFSPLDIIVDTFSVIEDTMQFSFEVPEWVRAGSYEIEYQMADELMVTEVDRYDRTLIDKRAGGSPLLADGEKIKETTNRPQSLMGEKRRMHPAKEWALGKPVFSSRDSIILSGSHPFDVSGITVYIKKSLMDTSCYTLGDTADVWMDIYSDVNMNCSLILSSTGSITDTFSLSLEEEMPNCYEFKYPISGMERGMNELYLHLVKDSMSLSGEVLFFDVYLTDTVCPQITVLEEPANTHSGNRWNNFTAIIWEADSNQTPIYDTLHYRISSVGGSSWQHCLPHSIEGDTHEYRIPPQPQGTRVEYYLSVVDSSKNRARYPETGVADFWILSLLRPSWSKLNYSQDTTVNLWWKPPEEIVSYNSGLISDTVNLGDNEVAVHLIPQYLPAELKKVESRMVKIGRNLSPVTSAESKGSVFLSDSLDTLMVNIYEVQDSLPGIKIDSFEFVKYVDGWVEFDVPNVEIQGEGIFIGFTGPQDVGVIFDGYGRGTHTAVKAGGLWSLNTSGETHLNALISYKPSETRQSEILSFDLYRSHQDTSWTRIASEIKDTVFTDTLAEENKLYTYKVKAIFNQPADSFSSYPGHLFVDLMPPELDTLFILTDIPDTLVVAAGLKDTSGIYRDSLGYKKGDTINLIGEDSTAGIFHYFSFEFNDDTLFYYLTVADSSFMKNSTRFPVTGFYKWANPSGLEEIRYPDSTYLKNLPQNPVTGKCLINYALVEKCMVKIVLYDILGRVSKTVLDEEKERGYYSVPLKTTDIPGGIYFLRMVAGGYGRTIKVVRLK